MPDADPLAAACRRAAERARRSGRSIALAVSESLPGTVDPLAVLGAMAEPVPRGSPRQMAGPLAVTGPLAISGPLAMTGAAAPARPLDAAEPAGLARRFYFEHPEGGFALAAGGRAMGWTGEPAPAAPPAAEAERNRRFEAVRGPLEAALAEAEAWAPAGEAPLGALAVGGFGFFDRLDAGAWPGFAPADMGLPEWGVLRRGGTAELLVQQSVAPGDDPAQVQARVAALRERLRAAATVALRPEGNPAGAPTRVEGLEPPEARAHWTQVVRTARDAIRAGHLRKVVLARPLDLVCAPAPDPLVLLARLRAAYPECYTFLSDPGAGTVYLGATPERLARLEPAQAGGPRVTLGALAGTFPRGATPEADAALQRLIRESPKEREEHAIVVEAIREALAEFGRLDVPEEPEVRALKNLWHLFTPITLVPSGQPSLLSLVARLHPTPAVGGLPRAAALEWIRRLESFDRGWYGAPLGWLNGRGEGEFAVTLRSGVVSGGRVRLFAGGGIVAESDPEREFEETRIKFQPLLSALGQE